MWLKLGITSSSNFSFVMISVHFNLKFYLLVLSCLLTAKVNQHIVRAEMDEHLTCTVPAEENLLVFFFKRSCLH